MASAAQIAANQANARRSTGPRTAEGKAASARNSASHGLCSKDFVILEGEEQEFSDFMDALQADIQPVGAVERDLFTQHAHASWGLRRCRRAEVASQHGDCCKGAEPLLNVEMADRLRRVDLYARRTERTYYRTLRELKASQLNRLIAPLAHPLPVTNETPAPNPEPDPEPNPAPVPPPDLFLNRTSVPRVLDHTTLAAQRELLHRAKLELKQGQAHDDAAIAKLRKRSQSLALNALAAFTAGS